MTVDDRSETQGFTWSVRVYYEDTDLGGVVYYANYLRFLERARTEWLRHLGFDQTALLRDSDLLFVIVKAEVRYLNPARFDDLLCVTARLESSRRTTMNFAQAIYRENPQGELLVTANVQAACVRASDFRPKAILPEMLTAMERTE